MLAQICYYFEAVAQLPQEARNQLVISVPSGNFGDLTAGLLAKSLGLPVKRFIAATNANDTVPRFLTRRPVAAERHAGDALQRHGCQPAKQLAARGRAVPP